MHFCFGDKMEDVPEQDWELALVRPAAMHYWVWSSAGGTTHTSVHTESKSWEWSLASQRCILSDELLLLHKLAWHQWKEQREKKWSRNRKQGRVVTHLQLRNGRNLANFVILISNTISIQNGNILYMNLFLFFLLTTYPSSSPFFIYFPLVLSLFLHLISSGHFSN